MTAKILPAPYPAFVISLDFELLWGVRDHHTRETYGANVLGAREAIPRMLDAFARYDIRATWATVGFLFAESKDELIAHCPERRPQYANHKLSNYAYLDEVGDNEQRDPYYFGASLLRRIAACPGQEIGTHTFSHFYCLEDGVGAADLEADLTAATTIAHRRGIALKSIVFPRNQYDRAALDVCRRLGLTSYRGNESGWLYRPSPGREQTPLRRAVRLGDAYLDLSGANSAPWPVSTEALVNVPSSRFLRPYTVALKRLEPLRLRRIVQAMTAAAARSEIFHLWWHPHNFGADLEQNLRVLDLILARYARLAAQTGMRSMAMGDFAVHG